MKCAPAQCSPNAVRVMVGFLILSQFFDLDLIVNELWYFFDIGHIDRVGQLRSCHRFFDHLSKGDHDPANETLDISGGGSLIFPLRCTFRQFSSPIWNLAKLPILL
ncbi:hypothetical protein ACFX11_046755 [Malus domestica]